MVDMVTELKVLSAVSDIELYFESQISSIAASLSSKPVSMRKAFYVFGEPVKVL